VAKIQYGVTTEANESYAFTKVTFYKVHWSAQKKSFPDKINDNCYSFDIAESEYENQIALSPTVVKGEGLNYKTTLVIKR
jgi:hypothetical protein